MNNIKFIIDGGCSNIININDRWGEIKLLKGKTIISNVGFIIQNDQIYIDTLIINEPIKKSIYPEIIIGILKGLSKIFGKPLFFDCDDADLYSFLITQEFISMNDITLCWIPKI